MNIKIFENFSDIMEKISTNCSSKYSLKIIPFFSREKKYHRSIKNVKKTDAPNEVKIYNEKKTEIKKNNFILWGINLFIFCLILVIILSILISLLYKNNNKLRAEKYFMNSEALQAFEQSFRINSKLNNFTQIIMNSTQHYYSLVDEIDLSYKIFTKAKFDIFTLEESKPIKNDKFFYSKKYKTVVIINSQCYDFLENSTNCRLEKYLDISLIKINNLRNNTAYDLNEIKSVLIPLCIIEHTNTNFIISVTCPETLPYNIKNDIINSFKSFKPESFKGNILDNNTKTDIEIKENNIYINKNEKECDDDLNNFTCELNRDIITDLDGNLFSSKKISKINAEINDKNKFNKIFNYTFEVNTSQNSTNFNIYKSNINYLLNLIDPFMVKEEYMTSKTFDNIMDDILQNKTFTKQNLRKLNKNFDTYDGIKKTNFFNESYYGINMELNLKNDIGLGIGEGARTSSNLIIGTKSYELEHFEALTELNKTMNDIITITKAGNNYAYSFYILINSLLLNLKNKIITEVSILNNKLTFKDLSLISEINIDDFEVLPYEFVEESQSFNSQINNIIINQPSELNDIISTFKNNILSFINKSHMLVNDIYINMKNIENTVFSDNNKIKDVSNYYLNIKDNFNLENIKTAKNILDNYYIKEKINIIIPTINNILSNFSNKSYEIIEVNQTNLDKIKQNLYKEKLSIKSVSKEQVKNVIQNLNDSKRGIDTIISNIENVFKDNIDTEDNGYFISQKKINENKKIYDENYEKLINLTHILQNDLLIDKAFDSIYCYFRSQFINVLNFLDISKRENFPLKENILSNSLFSLANINNIYNDFKNGEIKILKDIKEENNNYRSSIQKKLDYFKVNDEGKVIQLMNNIKNLLSETNLKNLAEEYDKLFVNSINSLNNIIENNIKLSDQYFKEIQNTTYCTKAFTNKANVYFNSFNQIKNYYQNQLRNDLTSLYLNVINQINPLLQKFKSIDLINNYPNLLSFSQTHINTNDILKKGFDKYISNEIFNSKYSPKIQNYINSGIKRINDAQNNYQKIYNKISKLSYINDKKYDVIVLVKKKYRCCKERFLGICIRRGNCYDSEKQKRKIAGANNHLKLKSYDFSQYTTNFLSFYNKIYPSFSSSVTSYYGTLTNLYNSLISIRTQTSSKKINSLDEIKKKIQNIINEKLSSNLFKSSYQYFRNEIINKLPSELNNMIDLWKNIFDKVNENITSEINEFKYPINEIGIIGNLYYQLYKNNISTDYINSIIEQRKNDLNYSIKYYYNLIISKVNEMNSYILNNLPKPTNEKFFDDILNQRINEIKQVLNNSLNILKSSKVKYLEMNTQLPILNLNINDYFSINSIINPINNNFKNEIYKKYIESLTLIEKVKKNISLESINGKIYIENLNFEKESDNIFDIINKGTFLDLKNNVYKDLIENNMKVDIDELINNIKTKLKESNESLGQKFKKEEEKYSNILKNKIYEEFFTPQELKNKINLIYSNGLNSIDSKSKDKILAYINEIIDKIKSHIIKEVQRLTNELTSYTKNYNSIVNTLNNYKNMIYKIIYSDIILIPNEFYTKINDKFYINYIQKYLNQYLNYANITIEEKYEFLNMPINLKEIINKNLLLHINEYKNITFSHIKSLYDSKIQELNKLFIFENIKKTINDELTNIYNNQLLPTLKKIAIYNSGSVGCADYDLSNSIKVDINDFILIKIRQIELILRKMKGKMYEINDNWKIPDFSLFQKNEFAKISNSFNAFFKENKEYEINEFRYFVDQYNKNNFKKIINNFIPIFGKDFFDNVFDYNNVQKIKSVYNNLKYSLNQTLSYYKKLIELYPDIIIPEDLKLNILSLKNLTTIIKIKNNNIINALNSKLNLLFEENVNIFIEKYINFIKNDVSLKLSFNDKIISIIEKVLLEKKNVLNKEYSDMINIQIKNPMIEKYKNSLNKESNDSIKMIEDNLKKIEASFKQIKTIKISNVINENQIKLNNLLKSIAEYNTYIKSFRIPNEVLKFFDEFSSKYLLPQYEKLYLILFDLSKNYIVKNLEKNSNNYKNYYLIKDFMDKSNDVNQSTEKYFIKINENIKDYGKDENKILKNINKEIIKYEDGIKTEEIKYHLKLDETLEKLRNSSNSVNEFIQNLSLFNTFNKTINKYINVINLQYNNSLEKIKKYKYDNETNLMLIKKLDDVKKYTLDYYSNTKSKYNEIKEYIKNNISEMDKLINLCVNITYDIISKKYINIKNNYKPIKTIQNKQESLINLEKYIWKGDEETYQINTKIDKYFYGNEIIFDIQFEKEDKLKPIIIGKIINRNKPQSLIFDVFPLLGSGCVKTGTLITANFNNISLLVDFNFDNYNNLFKINTTIDFDEYEVSYNKYQIKTNKFIKKMIGGIEFLVLLCSGNGGQNISENNDNNGLKAKVIKAKRNIIKELYDY